MWFRLGMSRCGPSARGIPQGVSCNSDTLRSRERLRSLLCNLSLFRDCHFFCRCCGSRPFCRFPALGPSLLHLLIRLLRYRALRLVAAHPQLFAAIQIRHQRILFGCHTLPIASLVPAGTRPSWDHRATPREAVRLKSQPERASLPVAGRGGGRLLIFALPGRGWRG